MYIYYIPIAGISKKSQLSNPYKVRGAGISKESQLSNPYKFRGYI